MTNSSPILETMDKAGYYSAEVWGGATFDVCLRYLQEDPWERLRKIRAKMPNTKLQMLLRGQNILGYKHYPDDVVRKFVEYSVKNGIDIIRIFDALNDVRNLEVAIDETVKQGAHASGTICFTTSPVHTLEKNVAMVKDLQKMGVKSIAIKDMAGIMGPKDAYDLVSAIKDAVPELPVVVHTHCTTGLAFMTYLKAVEAGADVIDTAISPLLRRHRPACHRDSGLRPAPAWLPGGPGRQGPRQDGRLLQGRPGRLPGRRDSRPHLHGHRYPVPELPDPRRHAVQSDLPAQNDERHR